MEKCHIPTSIHSHHDTPAHVRMCLEVHINLVATHLGYHDGLPESKRVPRHKLVWNAEKL